MGKFLYTWKKRVSVRSRRVPIKWKWNSSTKKCIIRSVSGCIGIAAAEGWKAPTKAFLNDATPLKLEPFCSCYTSFCVCGCVVDTAHRVLGGRAWYTTCVVSLNSPSFFSTLSSQMCVCFVYCSRSVSCALSTKCTTTSYKRCIHRPQTTTVYHDSLWRV